MTGADVREVYEAALPDEALEALIKSTGFQQRERRLLAKEFIRAAVIAAATGNGGRQADLLRTYFEGGAPKVVRGASYGWFGRPFEAMMEGVRERTFAYARSQVVDLPAVFGRHVRDWHVVDSTTVKLDSRLKSEYPGTGDYAALKLHKRFSIGLGTLWDYHISPARECTGSVLVPRERDDWLRMYRRRAPANRGATSERPLRLRASGEWRAHAAFRSPARFWRRSSRAASSFASRAAQISFWRPASTSLGVT
jgi:hypothetical protein